MELRASYPALVRRFPSMRLAVPADEIEFRELSVVYGVKSLPVTWKPAQPMATQVPPR